MNFFEEYESIQYRMGTAPNAVAKRIAQRYIADNPCESVMLTAADDRGFKCDKRGRTVIDFDAMYPEAPMGSYAYALGYFISDVDGLFGLSVTLKSEAWIYVNGEKIANTTTRDENVVKDRVATFNVKKGRNSVFVKCRKNNAGFGATVGTATKWAPINMYNPMNEFDGMLGFAYTCIFDEDIFAQNIPDTGEMQSGIWYPVMKKRKIEDRSGFYHAVSYFNAGGAVCLTGAAEDKISIFVDGNKIHSGCGDIDVKLSVSGGEHYIFVSAEHKEGTKGGFDIIVNKDGKKCEINSKVKGIDSQWIVSPMLKHEHSELISAFKPELLLDGSDGLCYWLTEYEDINVRLQTMGKNFGRWNYPLGVVMYGMTETARKLNDDDIADYTDKHMYVAARLFDYSRFDAEKYGFPCVMAQIADIDSLDDCGSFANAVLHYGRGLKGFEGVSELVSDYILNRQERLSDGIMYREKYGTISELTIWADDTYMSLPFLCRMYEYTGDEKYLNEITTQILLFAEYLYMPEKKLMSHIYSVKYEKKTGLHWGRGNGWVLFTLTEILRVLPKEHEKYNEILSLFNNLSDGFYNCIDENGMLHQLLDDHESYMEASCTAMCIVTYSRGVINGWLKDNRKYEDAVHKMWTALCRYCIKYNGDIYGVCQGSGFSFREEYYKNELPWCINDTHGTGIVLLAAMAAADMDHKQEKEEIIYDK